MYTECLNGLTEIETENLDISEYFWTNLTSYK